MNNVDFISDPHIEEFVVWLTTELPKLSISLSISRSDFVPGGLNTNFTNFENTLSHYSWAGNWSHNKKLLGNLAKNLHGAISSQNNLATLTACLEILRWGGVRGAVAFLTTLAQKDLLVDYLETRSPLFSLTGTQRLSDLNPMNIDKFDAGMTKIYSLIDATGSPIYDSRVGAAMAMLYQCFLRMKGRPQNGLLNFPSGSPRGKQIRNPGALGAGFLNAPQFYTKSVQPHTWAQFQLKLGWIIQEVLSRKIGWFKSEETMAARCRAFEACLFMIGYDLRSICGNTCCDLTCNTSPLAPRVQPVIKTTAAKPAESTNTGWVPSGHPFRNVLTYFLEFRNSNQAAYSLEDFRNWLIQQHDFKATTVKAYDFPLREQEFDLVDRTIEDLECIVMGGQAGLECVLRDRTLNVDERAWVCLVDAWIVGKLISKNAADRNAILIEAGFAGTENACNTLFTVGRTVGKHFGLLDVDGSPTKLYEDTFAGHMDDLEESLCGIKQNTAQN